MPKRILCVPNYSEGRRAPVIQAIAEAAQASGVTFHHRSWDVDHNRMVLAFSGTPRQVRQAVLATGSVAVREIDLTRHEGVHPRIGAMDVVPFVPIEGIGQEEAVAFSRQVAQAFASTLKVPVYLYEHSAGPGRIRDLPTLRKGGFEAWAGQPLRGERKPDFGRSCLHVTAGATIMGVRDPLIALNVNLATDQVEIAREIARRIRQERLTNSLLTGVRALGFYLSSRQIAQVSLNLTQPDRVDLLQVFQYVRDQAASLGVQVTSSELIGVILLPNVAQSLGDALQATIAPEQIIPIP